MHILKQDGRAVWVLQGMIHERRLGIRGKDMAWAAPIKKSKEVKR